MKLLNKSLCILLCLCLFAGTLCFAQETAEMTEAEKATGIVEAVAEHLDTYGRYELQDAGYFYKEALLAILEEHPELYEDALRAMLHSVDPYSEYYTEEESKQLLNTLDGVIVGIGVTLEFFQGDYAVISSVIPDTPADRAGLQVGDKILKADGVDLYQAKSEIVLNHVRGEEGTQVVLEIERNGAVLTVEMVREPIVGTSVTKTLVEENGQKVMYIKIHGFVSNTAESFQRVMEEVEQEGIVNLIIDLRDNGGGYLNQAISMAALFVPEGKVVTTFDSKLDLFDVTYLGAAKESQQYDIALLVNEKTASASEVFAAALWENGLACTIGAQTYGKGTVQALSNLASGGMMKFTNGFYLTPLGNNINGVGLTPDAVVENPLRPVKVSDYEKFSYTRVYNEGDTGKDVKLAKEILSLYGMYQGAIDETFNRELYYAVFAFQTQAGLYPYGCLDLTTQGQIYSYLSVVEEEYDSQLETAFRHFGMSMSKE